MRRSFAGRGMDVRQRWMDPARWLDAATTELTPQRAIANAVADSDALINVVSRDSASGRLVVY